MIPPLSILIIAFAADIVRAHFSLKYPPPLGDLKEQGEGTGPCGGYAFDLKYAAETTDFHVGGDSILVTTGHPQNKWLYRISVATNNGSDVNPSNWTQVYPIVLQGGLNSYCQPAVTIPDGFVGQKAILSVVGKAQDGLLYQVRHLKIVNTLHLCLSALLTSVELPSLPNFVVRRRYFCFGYWNPSRGLRQHHWRRRFLLLRLRARRLGRHQCQQ